MAGFLGIHPGNCLETVCRGLVPFSLHVREGPLELHLYPKSRRGAFAVLNIPETLQNQENLLLELLSVGSFQALCEGFCSLVKPFRATPGDSQAIGQRKLPGRRTDCQGLLIVLGSEKILFEAVIASGDCLEKLALIL